MSSNGDFYPTLAYSLLCSSQGTPKVVKVSSLSSRQNYGIAKSDIKVIATDVDGTLLDTSQNLSQANEEAIKLAADQGVQAIYINLTKYFMNIE